MLLPATPGWVSLPVVVGGPRHSWLGSAGGGGVWCVVWCVVCCWGSSPLLAEVPVCYSPPLLAGFRCRWWWAVPATPGWGPLAAVVCVLCLAGSGGPASWARSGAPHPFLWPLYLSALLGPLRAGVAPLSFAAVAVPRWLFFSASRYLARASFVSPAWPLAALWWLLPRPPPPLCLAVFVAPACGLCVFFSPSSSSSVRPRCLRLSLVSGPGCPGPRRLRCLFCWPSASRLSVRLSLFRAFRLAVGCSRVVPAPPPPCVARFSFLPLGAVCRVVLCVPGCGAAPRCCVLCRPVLCCRVLCCARLVLLLVAPCPLALPVALGPCALRRCVLRCSPAMCALCCVCFVVAWWCVLLFAALPCAVCVSGCCAVRSLCSPFCAVLCFAVLVRSRCAVRVPRAVACAWCCGALLCVVLFPVVCRGAVLGLVARGCLLVGCFGVGVPVWPRGLLPCGWCGLLWCPAFLCCVLWCCAVAWCCAVVLCCRVAVLLGLALPSCGPSCCAVLCCSLAVLFLARWWCLRAVVLFSSRCAFPVFSALCAAVPCCAGCGALLPCVVCCAVVWCCAVVLCCRFAVLFVFALPSCGLSCGACVVCAVVGASCCGVSLCVVVSPWAFCGVVVLLWCVVVSCCAVRCPVVSCALCRVLRCRAVLRCCAGWLCRAVVCAAGVCFVLFSFAKNPCRFSVPFKTLFFFF